MVRNLLALLAFHKREENDATRYLHELNDGGFCSYVKGTDN